MLGLLRIVILFYFFINDFINCRNHIINIKNDKRPSIKLSRFGYNPNSYLFMTINKFEVHASNDSRFGFSVYRNTGDRVSSLLDSGTLKCFLQYHDFNSVTYRYNQINQTITVETHGSNMAGLLIYKDVDFPSGNNLTQLGIFNITYEVQKQLRVNIVTLLDEFMHHDNATYFANQIMQPFKDQLLLSLTERKALLNVVEMNQSSNAYNNLNILSDLKMVLVIARKVAKGSILKAIRIIREKLQSPVTFQIEYPLRLLIQFPTNNEEGEYVSYFHNCAPPNLSNAPVNISMTLIEKNWNSYLSVGHQPLPLLFFAMCSVYIVLSVLWSVFIFKSEHLVFKIHYLMLTLLIMKSLTLFFHGINYYELGRHGVPEQGWAVMYYITHLLKGALLFTTITLIGAGWAFIKHMLTDKEKRLFIVIIPLQILANVATIILDETEKSSTPYKTWKYIFLLVDFICCTTILLPVIWSIKHLKEASNIDGKQYQNLQKLKLFRHFYLLVIGYIYSTRIIVYLLMISVSFKLTWTVDLFRELATVFFMVVTGYRFRPVSNNPYLHVPWTDDDDDVTEQEQLEHAWSQCGVTDGVVRINQLSMLDSDSDNNDTVYQNTVHTDRNNGGQLIMDSGFVHTSRL